MLKYGQLGEKILGWGVLVVYKAKSVINVESKLRTEKWQADEQKGI